MSHHVRTAGDYDGALRAGPLPAQGLALALGIPVDYAEHDVLKLVELGVLREGREGYYERVWRD